MQKPRSCQSAHRRREAVEGGVKLPGSAATPPRPDASARKRIGDHSPNCREKGGTESDTSRQLWAIPGLPSDTALRPGVAVLVRGDSTVLAPFELPRELWRHSRCATTRRIGPHVRAGNPG